MSLFTISLSLHRHLPDTYDVIVQLLFAIPNDERYVERRLPDIQRRREPQRGTPLLTPATGVPLTGSITRGAPSRYLETYKPADNKQARTMVALVQHPLLGNDQ